MPYIKQDRREQLDPVIERLDNWQLDAGDLNYVVSRLAFLKIKREGKSYMRMALIIGTLVCAILEIYRRMASPYEDEKIKENGDAFK